jgi:hypothetical protein
VVQHDEDLQGHLVQKAAVEAKMQIEEPKLEELAAFANEQFALDIRRDRPEVNRLAAIGLTTPGLAKHIVGGSACW